MFFHFRDLRLLLFLSFACTCLYVRCPPLQRLVHFLEGDSTKASSRVEVSDTE
jgi:hypothetical protein